MANKKLIKKYQQGDTILVTYPQKGIAVRLGDEVLFYPEIGGDLGDPTSYTVDSWNEYMRRSQQERREYEEAFAEAKKKYFEEHPEDIGKTRLGEFAFRPVRYAEGVDPYIDTYTGEPILNGQNILTRNGEVVTTKSLDWLDWLAETNQILPGKDLPELIVHAVPTGKKSFYQYNTIGDDYDEYAERKQNAPIATTKQWEQIKEKEADENFISTPIGHEIWLRLKDKEAREKTPGVGALVVTPTLLGLGATALMYNPIALPLSFLGAEVGATTADYPFLQQGYGSFGDWLFQGTNAPEWLKENSNPGLWLGGGAGWSIGKGLERGLGIKLLKRPTLLSDTYENRWDLEDILYEREQERLANASANNYLPAIPNAVLDVEAIELSSSVPKIVTSVKRPGVFYSKVGETNEGSVFSLAAKALKDKFKKAFGNDPVWNLMERAGIPEELRGSVEISLFGKNIPDQNNIWIDPMTGFRQPIAAPNMTDEEIIKVFSEGASLQLKRLKSPEFKALVQKEMGWGDTEYNELMQEINNRLKDGHSIKVRGINELQQGYVANTNILPDGSVIYTINRDRFAATPFDPIISLKSSGAHEFYHGLTGGIRGTNQVQGATQSMLAKKYPRLALIMDHNADLVKTFEFNEWANYFANTPKNQIVLDLRNAGFTEKQIEEAVEINIPRANSFKNYINSNLETAARSTTAAKYGLDSSDYDDLAQFYTQESLDQSGRLLSKVGEINEGSLLTAIKNGIREIQKELITPETFTKFPSIEILRAQRAAESLGLIDRAKQLAKLYEDKVIIEKYGKNAIVKENAKRISDKMWDEQYFQAIKNIDVDEAQRLRDLHFYAKTGIEPITRYHGSPSPYNRWSHLGFSDFGSDPFHHFATLEEIAAGFGPTRKFYLNIQNPVRVKDLGAVWHPYKLGKELHKNVPYKTPAKYDLFTYNDSEERYTYEVMKDYLGTDGLVYDNRYEGGGDSFAIPDSRFAKLADAVTFDDSGNIIPLSKRDDFTTRNILYSKIGDINEGSVLSLIINKLPRKLFSTTGEVTKGSAIGIISPTGKLSITDKVKTAIRDQIRNAALNLKNEINFWRNLDTPINSELTENILLGKTSKLPKEYKPVVTNGPGEYIVDELMHNTYGRRLLAYLKERPSTNALGNTIAPDYAEALLNSEETIRNALSSIKVGGFPKAAFDIPELEGVAGFFEEKGPFIGYPKRLGGRAKFDVLRHELEHYFDTIVPLTPKQKEALLSAYDENFLELSKRLRYPDLWEYEYMADEITTTNGDARNYILNRVGKFDDPIAEQNDFIKDLSDETIFNAVERANEYGKTYIDWLRRHNQLTPKKAELFRQAMILCAKIGEVNKGSVAGASRRPILRKNMHEFSDAEWDAAYEAALEKGNRREMWRLLTLRFLQKAKEYIANGGGDPKVLFRGDWRDYFLKFKKDGVWLSSDPVYALNFTEDKIARDHVLFPSKVRKYFVKGTSEQLLPKNVYYEITPGLPKSDYYWDPITNYLMFGVPDELRRYATMNNAENNLRKILGKPLKQLTAALKKAHKLGSADVIFGQDSPVHGFPYWHNSQGLEYNVANPNYVKSANLITYDDAGNMIPLSLRFNFGRNDRRYSWLIPLLPFLYPNKKDQAE